MKLVVIPAWLKKKLEANNYPLNVVLDTERLSTILTKEDLFFLLEANSLDMWTSYANRCDVHHIGKDFSNYSFNDKILMMFKAGELEVLAGQYGKVTPVEQLALCLGCDITQEEFNLYDYDINNYETVMLDEQTVAVCVEPCLKSESTKKSLEAFLETIQGNLGYDKTCKLDSFKLFISRAADKAY